MKLNLGGGATWSMPGWTNLDLTLGCNLRQPSPLTYAKDSVELIFCSHTLEHMPVDDARKLILACHYVLKPDGLLRLVVPDCQKFAQAWLKGDNSFFTANRFLTPHFQDLTQCFIEMGGNRDYFENASTIGHCWFWDGWTLTWLLALCGFTIVEISAFGKSGSQELREVATMNEADGMPLRGFDNPYTEPISVYVEAQKA